MFLDKTGRDSVHQGGGNAAQFIQEILWENAWVLLLSQVSYSKQGERPPMFPGDLVTKKKGSNFVYQEGELLLTIFQVKLLTQD